MHLLFRVIIVLPIIFLTINGYSQHSDSIQNSTLGIHFFVNDHFYRNSFKAYINPQLKKTFPGLALSFTKGISKHFDWNAMAYATFADSIIKNKQPLGKKDLFVDANFSIRAKMFSNVRRVQPFLQTGIGLSQYKDFTGVFIPIGVGVQMNVFQDVYLTLQTKYSLSPGSTFRNYYSHSLGVAGVIGKPRRKAAEKFIVAPVMTKLTDFDRDRDGIPDTTDICPNVPGLKQFNGCPDRDNDGVEDRLDQCPDIPGFIQYQGCPVPDTDKDGILDNADKCIDVPGVKDYHGCPVPDKDNDGIADDQDQCPDEKGSYNNRGCPEINQDIKEQIQHAAKNIFFNTGSDVLLAKSFSSLDEVVTILKNDSKLKLNIEGHTDNVGDSTKNQGLSDRRANAVLNYLSDKGISKGRLNATGFGEGRPVVENNTAKGRSINRRVELKLSY